MLVRHCIGDDVNPHWISFLHGKQFKVLSVNTFAFPTITEVGVSATGMATTFPVTVRLDEETAEARSGMAAEVTFRFGTGEEGASIIVPTAAVLEDRTGRFVYVLEPGGGGMGFARRREVQVGAITNEGMEIRSGLSEGDLVITAGARRISDGQQVRTDLGSTG